MKANCDLSVGKCPAHQLRRDEVASSGESTVGSNMKPAGCGSIALSSGRRSQHPYRPTWPGMCLEPMRKNRSMVVRQRKIHQQDLTPPSAPGWRPGSKRGSSCQRRPSANTWQQPDRTGRCFFLCEGSVRSCWRCLTNVSSSVAASDQARAPQAGPRVKSLSQRVLQRCDGCAAGSLVLVDTARITQPRLIAPK